MSSYSIQQANSELEAMLHGTTLNQIVGIYSVHRRAASQLLLDLDPQETKRTSLVSIFDHVFDYAGISDLKGNKMIDIRPQANRKLSEVYIQKYGQDFDVWKALTNQPNFNITFDTYTKSMRVEAINSARSVSVNAIDDTTANGTWAAGGGASSISQDTVYVADGSASLQFNLAAGQTTGYIENSTQAAVDLSSIYHVNVSSLFLWVYLPTGSSFTNVNLRWGSSSSAYYSQSVTTNQKGNAFTNGWNLLKFDWSSASTTGSPNAASISYLRLTFTYDSTAQTSVHANALFSSLPLPLEFVYYSKFIFRDSTGAFKETPTADSDLLNLDTETYNVYLWQLALQAVHQQDSQTAQFDIKYFSEQYANSLMRYKSLYKSELQKPHTNYYRMTPAGFLRFLGQNRF